ncbi:Pleiotropic drug resistance protein 13 [Acorus calamus]|uniref:Pleiotropic drug resistance protein 13 n=1 Tax=Acorus calamus TaxID=4465 RepID=A0AAV9DB30_ACOCL|nr:Pleiotropic drug resistance protein 13 [Acorus calamus]
MGRVDVIKPWWVWAFWVSPLSYGQRAISVNEFSATGWKERYAYGNETVGYNVLHSHGLPVQDSWYWINWKPGKAQNIIPAESNEESTDDGNCRTVPVFS